MNLKDTLNEALKGKFRRFSKNAIQTKKECNYFPKNTSELKEIIDQRVEEDPECDLNDIWVGDIDDMRFLFNKSPFNGDISRWDVSNVKNMNYMFCESKFNGDISRWDVSSVKDMCGMFSEDWFNGDISDWDVSNVENMSWMFYWSDFTGDISRWDVGKVENMSQMFFKSKFNGDINSWDTRSVKWKVDIFENCPLKKNPPIWY